MFAKETYTTHRNSLKKRLGIGFLLFLGQRGEWHELCG